ncbi:hypothetical protein CTP10_R52070 [Cupriavidus sp. P-10]|uniref:hypothetical protein n=1 Tax=Cupriavidus sp. P-10 TaxID=2027911 RepID=UPI0011C0FA8F|nr:hypothetical protein [Cupriavidus sp. P-10]BDB27797.1 hypothetical protein CTP10_R52070 [Cupriavidus sp. P-10]
MSKSGKISCDKLDLRKDWPVPAYDLMAEAEREAVQKRMLAMALRLNGHRYKVVESLTGMKRQAVHSMLRRAEMIAPDGKPYGYRASLPHLQINVNAKRPSRCTDHRWHKSFFG